MSIVDKLKACADNWLHECEQSRLERKAAEEIWRLREVVRGVRIMANAGAFKQWEGESWLKRVKDVDLES